MKPGPRLPGMFMLTLILVVTSNLLIAPAAPVHAQITAPAGVVAFAGDDAVGNTGLYVLDLASGRVGRVDLPVAADVSFAWQPDGEPLAFTTADGSYGLLRSLRGCFDAEALCSDIVEVIPPFVIQELAWTPDGDALLFRTEDGMKLSPPRARPAAISDVDLPCDVAFAVSREPYYVFCAVADAAGNVQTSVYQQQDSAFAPDYQIGTFPQITAFDVGPEGRSVVGTLEAAGDSGFYSPSGGPAARLANYQVHVYDLEFAPDGARFAIAGATSDSTGDGTLRDGDPAELFLYDTTANLLAQVPGFTEATALTWSPDGSQVLVITQDNEMAIYTPQTMSTIDVAVSLPAPGLVMRAPAWNPAAPESMPLAIATATPKPPMIITATPNLQLTVAPTFTPWPTPTPWPTLTPYPTFTPWPTLTPIPSVTPGSPIGTGCQYAFTGGGGLPVAVGDTAEVTPYGAAVRFRTGAALNAPMIRELMPGTRMTILSGPYCSQGYRWWEARLESDGRTGYLADSDPVGYWITTASAAPPAESISFYADRYSITLGQCATIVWDVEGIQAVYYQGAGVTGHETRSECPATSTTYTLRVVLLDSTEAIRQVTILVTAP